MMRGASRASFGAAEDRLETLLDNVTDPADRIRLAEDLFAVTGLLDATPSLRRALTDPSRAGDDRSALASRLLDNRISRDAAALVAGVVRDRWSQTRDLADALEALAISATLAAAESGSRLGTVEEEVFRFERTVASDGALRRAITETRAPVALRTALVDRLLADRCEPETAVLVRHVAAQARGRTPEASFAQVLTAAAKRRRRLVARVTSASLLTQAQRDRLESTLARRYGHEIRLALDVDPSIVGGLRVQIGDDVYDATLTRRIAEATEHLNR